MARDERKRQKKLAGKKAKRKKARAGRKSAGVSFSLAAEVLRASKAPVHECLVPEGLFDAGIGNVIISRRLANGYLGVGVFLLDVFCLGVKNAFFRTMPDWEYETTFRSLRREEDFDHMSAECVRKLVEDAVDYAKDLGFSPHSDYRLAGKIFGDIDKSACQMSFEFGQDGKPTYISGPYDTPAKSKRIINTLAERCGPDGFDYVIMIAGTSIVDSDDEFDDEDIIDIEAIELDDQEEGQ